MTLGTGTKLLLLFLLPSVVSLAWADENEELGVENKPGRTMTAKEAVAKSWALTKKYEKAKAGLGEAFGLSEKKTIPAAAAVSATKEVQPKPVSPTDVSYSTIKLKNGQTLKNCSIVSRDKKGFWVVYEGNIRLYLTNEEVKDVSKTDIV